MQFHALLIFNSLRDWWLQTIHCFMFKTFRLAICAMGLVGLASSCGTKLVTTAVAYQSVRTTFTQPSEIPQEAKIAVCYDIDENGNLNAVVFNRTSEIMIIDQTKSFFVNSDGQSTSYFDPTVRTTSQTDMSSATKGASVNLGAVGNALGIGGTLGSLLGGINVGGSTTGGTAVTNTTYISDLPQVSLAPYSNGAMSKVFKISRLGCEALDGTSDINVLSYTQENSPCRFSVCISYSVNNGNTFEKLVTDFYVNSVVVHKCNDNQSINSTLLSVYQTKPDLLYEPWWVLYFPNNGEKHLSFDCRRQGLIYDFQ